MSISILYTKTCNCEISTAKYQPGMILTNILPFTKTVHYGNVRIDSGLEHGRTTGYYVPPCKYLWIPSDYVDSTTSANHFLCSKHIASKLGLYTSLKTSQNPSFTMRANQTISLTLRAKGQSDYHYYIEDQTRLPPYHLVDGQEQPTFKIRTGFT